MITARQSRHCCFQPKPVEISAKWTIEGKRYRARLRHAPIHEALALNVQRQNSVGHMALEEHGIKRTPEIVSRAMLLAVEIQVLRTSFPLTISSVTRQPGSIDDVDGYNEAGRNVVMFEDGGDGIAR